MSWHDIMMYNGRIDAIHHWELITLDFYGKLAGLGLAAQCGTQTLVEADHL